MASGLDNKISNIIGTKLPQWLIQQLDLRANRNSDDVRSNKNLLYLANKSAWVRLVSSVDVDQERDQKYFSRISGIDITTPQSLAKNFVLFGGTSKYKENNSYQLRSGISYSDPNKTSGGAYGILGKEEIQKYGYRPMPGIMSVTIETQGKLGSIRGAIINFKCWDKQQLDIIDALYFKLGFTMFLEWGHTFFYTSDQDNLSATTNYGILKATEDYAIVDPFRSIKVGSRGSIPDFPTKEEINFQITKTVRDTEGNYDAMLGMVTNFNFSYNQDGGYDCTLRLMSLGMLGDSIKINNPSTLPRLLESEVLLLDKTLKLINQQELPSTNQTAPPEAFPDAAPGDLLQFLAINKIVNYDVEKTAYRNVGYKTYQEILTNNKALFDTIAFSNFNEPSRIALRDFNNIVRRNTTIEDSFIFASSNFNRQVKSSSNKLNFLLSSNEYYELDYFASDSYAIGKKGVILSPNNTYKNISIDLSYLKRRYSQYIESSRTQLRDPQIEGFSLPNSNNNLGLGLLGLRESDSSTVRFSIGYKSLTYDETGPATSDLKSYPATYFFTIAINRAKKSKTGTVLNNATDLEIYQSLIKILESDILSNVSFASSTTPFSKSNILKQYTKLSGIINDNLPYSFAVKFQQQLDRKQRINIANPNVPQTVDPNLPYNEQLKAAEQIRSGARESQQDIDVFLDVTIAFNDSQLFYSIEPEDPLLKLRSEAEIKAQLDAQNKQETAKKEQERKEDLALLDQIEQSLSFQSALELTLRTIQVHALNKAIWQVENKPDKNIGNKVYVLEIAKDNEFLKTVFSNGLFSPFIDELVSKTLEKSPDGLFYNNTIFDSDSKGDPIKISSSDRLKTYAKYGFLSSLLGNNTSLQLINSLDGNVNYNKLLTAFVIPYRIEQELVAGIKTNHPVYIPFGFLLMLLNHSCTIYDSNKQDSLQRPLVYIDYNPELNFFLTNNQQLSTDPFKVLIPFEGSDQDYQKLFYDEVLTKDKTGIAAYKNEANSIPLFKPRSEDLISFKLQEYCPIKLGKIDDSTSSFRGRIMNVLLSIDYLTDLVRQYSLKDGSNNVYLRPFLESILTTINKSLGNFNSLRLAYNDASNTFQIIDDQVIPTLGQEIMAQPKPNPLDITNRTEIPLIGKTSIAKSLETRTDIGSKLGSLIAISANPNMKDKSTLSKNGDTPGFLNTSFSDRYVTNRLAIESNNTSSLKDSRISEAIMFNSTITDFYSSANPSDTDVSQVTSYYIEKMSKVKNETTGTLAAAMVPIGINFTTDGVSGMNMYQAFTVSDELLPYSYTMQYREGYINNYDRYVGFVVVGLNHTIEANQWNTSVRTNMIALKDKTAFEADPIKELPKNEREFTETSETVNSTSITNVNFLSYQLNIMIPFFKNNLKFNDIATAAALGNLIQESGLNHEAWNIGETVGQKTTINAGSSRGDTLTDPNNLTFTGRGFTNRGVTAYGIAQWTQDRKKAYIEFKNKNGGDSLQNQLKFLQSELNSSYKKSVLEPMKLQNDIVSATSVWLRNYEGINADLQRRVSYANGVLEYIKAKGL